MAHQQDFNNILTTPDVLIVGAGSAGIAAVAGASKCSVSIQVVEKNKYPGGKATSAFVGTVCGLFYTRPDKEAKFIVEGFPREFGERLMLLSETQPEFQNGGLHFFPYQRDSFINLCNEITEPANISYNTEVTSIEMVENEIHEVAITKNDQTIKIYPKVVIDCSGEAITCKLTNSYHLTDDQYQAAAQVFSLSGLLATDSTSLSLSLARIIRKGIEQNEIPKEYEKLSLVPGTYKQGGALFKLGIPHIVDLSESSISEIEHFSKNAVHEIHSYLKSNSDPFEFSKINFIAPEAGIRTGPRNAGKYILTEEDVLSCRKFDNAIARGSWPVEFWEPGKNVVMSFFKENDFYEIPAGCLISSTINNLYFAGRTISATDKAIASARVIGTCLQTGFSAGMLAGGIVNSIKQSETIQEIQKILINKIQE